MRQDFRFALRMVRSHRWFSAAVISTLAFGIGLNTMVFTLVDAVLFKPVPVPGGARLVSILSKDTRGAASNRSRPVSWRDYRDYRAQTTSFAAIEAGLGDEAILSENDIAPQRYQEFRVSAGFFGMLRMTPIRGRDFMVSDMKPGAPPVILLGYGVWKERYGSRDVVGRNVRVGGKPATIIGVMPRGFRFPRNEDLWMPLDAGTQAEDRSDRRLELFAMLKPGIGIEKARANLDVVSTRLAHRYPNEDKDTGALLQTFHQRYSGGEIQIVFSLMMAAVGLVLLIACANVANMLLGRALARRREVAVRAALGASRWQIARQLLTESLVLSLMGGAAGLALAAIGVHRFDLATEAVGKPYWIKFTMDYRVFFYFAAVCVGSALAFGLMPALRSSKDASAALQDGARSAGTRHGGKLSGALVVFQFALTLVLLLGAGVFMRAFVEKQNVNAWIPGDRLLTARVDLPEEKYKDGYARRMVFETFLARVKAIPGVAGAAMCANLPGTGAPTRHIEIEGSAVQDEAHAPSASVATQSRGYFSAIGLPILRGRDFNDADGSAGQLHAIVTRQFAAHFWGAQDPIGRRFRLFDNKKPGEWYSVTGVSADLVQQPLDPAPDPLLFLPYRQSGYGSMSLLVKTPDPRAIAPAVRSALQGIDQDLPLFELATMNEVSAKQIWFLRLFGTIFLVFAAMATMMAAVGIYAVMAQSTGSRTREIGVRIALGSTSGQIMRLVLRRGIGQLAGGLALGAAAAWPVTRVLKGLRFLNSASDPLVISAVAIALCVVGVLACWLPARRAAALNPVSAIRAE